MDSYVLTVLIAAGAGVLLCAASAAAAAPAPREHGLFDRGWRFHRGDEPKAWKADWDDSGWRKVDLPHDWSVEDLPAREDPANAVSVTAGMWSFHRGDDPAWKEPALDDSAWEKVRLPAYWEDHSGYTQDNVYGWYRRRFDVPAAARGEDVTLLLGKVDDVDETFVNGVRVGGTGTFPPHYQTAYDAARRYRVPAGILKGDGTDVVAVRVFDGEGKGGLYAEAPAARRSGPFDSEAEGGAAQGFTTGGIGWYRKAFTLPERQTGKRVILTFDGVYMNSQVWVNGKLAGGRPYGYSAFQVDATPYIHFGAEKNVVAVKVDASGRTSRWYSGAGIYRHVCLTVANRLCVAPYGVAVTTPEVSAAAATVRIRTAVANGTASAQHGKVTSRVLAPDGGAVATVVAEQTFAAGATADVEQTLRLAAPALWSTDDPKLYRLVTSIEAGGRPVDRVETTFGIRSIEFRADAGFLLNGKPLKLRGGCIHHDNGCLGACAFDRAEERRVEALKASGFNAIRTSHNPPSPAFLDACDRLGVVVMDEAFDCWSHGKNTDDYGRFFVEWWEKDLSTMVLRDRNHPSVVMWSIGNEIPEQGKPEGAEMGAKLAAFVRALDPTRPVAQAAFPVGAESGELDPLFEHLGVAGYNYMWGKYEIDHKRHPGRVMAGTESMAVACFDHWMAVEDHPYVIGDFVWTALDYIGEAALGHTHFADEPAHQGAWPYTLSNCGDLDLCCWKRPQSYYRDAVWGVGRRVSCFVQNPPPPGKQEVVYAWGWHDERPSWTWPGREGQALTVRVYSSCPRVRLMLNGQALGEKPTDRGTRFTAEWQVPYQPGELTAVGLDPSGAEVDRWALRTAGKPASLRVTVDRKEIRADGEDLCYATVEVVDADGVLDPRSDAQIRFVASGAAHVIGVGNGDPLSLESFQASRRKVYRGRCLVVLRAGYSPGPVMLRAESPGLRSGAAEFAVR